MFELRWSARAAQDFDDLLAYVASENPGNARLVRERILKTLGNLESFSLGLPGPLDTLKLYIPKTSFFVVFRRDEKGNIGIRAFVHASRDWEDIDWEKM